ncbi:uncharacterized protein N7459_006735 [Penicillium hispanicum]|uniref:uncharacterized protein n=1 Tax=Penicillium hispanicum TaxID=1080232 RepID=UPI00253FACC1|nr:uncharacterized protein N7459_006735 [Penicillium hispanicum]KAJ5577771.1 hypothetical protein N7459_006735 [Penicillium hispanicum]
MDFLTTESRAYENQTIECWDDDGDLQLNDGLQSRAASSAGSITNPSLRPCGHRDSISSRRSARSDLDSNVGDEDWQVFLHDNDDLAKEEAFTSAKNAGIPLPANVPKSALLGGKIRRLSTCKPKRTFVDDWSDDVELPAPGSMLELKIPRDTAFPETIRQVSSTASSPVKFKGSPSWNEDISTRLKAAALTSLDRFQDEIDESAYSNIPTIRAPLPRSPQRNTIPAPMLDQSVQQEADEYDRDLELPPDHQPLQLSTRKDATGVSSPSLDDFDLEWSEGSIGVRVGGTARDGRSLPNSSICSLPSSSISIASPSVSSCLTGESEDDGLDGLILPDGPLDFNRSLQKRQEANATDVSGGPEEGQGLPGMPDAEDFFSGIEVDNGRVFASGKLTLNPNVKCNKGLPASPTRRPATTLTFTNSASSPRTRIPRLSGHDRTHSTHLETVSESGAPLSKFQRPQSLLGHASQTSISSLPGTAALSSSPTQTTSARKLPGTRNVRNPVSVHKSNPPSRHLRTKRSLPAIRGVHSAAPALTSQRLPSHHDGAIRSSYNRPTTPVGQTTTDIRSSTRRIPGPSNSAGALEKQSHHANVKTYRPSRRANSGSPGDLLSSQGTFSRLSRSTRNDSFRLSLGDKSTETVNQGDDRALTCPTRRRNFGDGTELESFDDLPTSASAESKFVKHPAGRGAPRSVRTRLSQSHITPPSEALTPSSTPLSTSKPPNPTPRFARDTNASRNAREQRIASMNSRNRDVNPLGSFNSNWKAHPVSRISPNAAPLRSRKPKAVTKAPTKPHLIKPMGSGVQDAKSVRGMRYNPAAFRWEGNENLVQDFDISTISKSPKPAPALITNMGTMQNVQTVGGMVFDPHRMCWLRARSLDCGYQDGMPPEDEDDVFAGLDDLEDKSVSAAGRALDSSCVPTGDDLSAGESSDEGPITEEFDVGPEFIRRQRAEEEKWRRKVEKWVGFDRGGRESPWQWAIRDLVADGMGDLTA